MKWFFLALGAAALGVGAAAACSSSPSDDLSTPDTDAGKRRDTGATEPEEEDAGFDPNATVVDFDSGVVAEAGDNGSCTGQADGVIPAGSAAPMRCCNQLLVNTSQTGNCGACGTTCPNGGECVPVPGHDGAFRCAGCLTNDECKGAGFGAAATCFDTANLPAYCNCQCPGDPPTTCQGQCPAGATCNEVEGTNYCAY